MNPQLIVRCPDSLHAERRYAAQVVLETQLGIAHEVVFEARDDVLIHAPGAAATRTLGLSDGVFACGDAAWPAGATRPPRLDGEALRASRQDGHATLAADVFGTAFWYLTRLEELLSDARDAHGRFPVEASGDEHQRPLVDELCDALGREIAQLWPALPLRRHVYACVATHDVDRPFKHLYQTGRQLLRTMARDALRRRAVGDALRSPRRRLAVRRGEVEHDPFYSRFDWLMDESERAGLRSTFYFLCAQAPGGVDGDYRIDDPRIGALLARVHARGHAIGLHGSYASAFDAALLAREAAALRRACEAQRIPLGPLRARQHVLRFDVRRTVGVWAEAGIAEDSTLAHAGRAGFRCGSCRAYPLFDLANRRATAVVERPLVAMDVSLLEPRYEGLAPAAAQARLDALIGRCRSVGGEFVLLWHNCQLEAAPARQVYAHALARAAGAG